MKQTSNIYRFNLVYKSIILIAAIAFVPALVAAQNAFSESYVSVGDLQRGVVVSVVESEPTKVEASNLDNADRVVGVIVDQEQALLHSSEPGQDVQVATAGTAMTFVSNLSGDIEPGDLLTASPIDGVAMKADKEDVVLGRALVGFSAESDDYIEREISDEAQQRGVLFQDKIYLGVIPVAVDVSQNPNNLKLSGLAGFAQQIIQTLTDSGVSPVRLLIVLLIFLITSSFLVTLLYGAITGSISSIGRNPLVKKDIFRSMYKVIGLSVVILIAMIAVIFLILS